MLGRQLSLRKWLALFLLTAGIALVQLPTGNDAKPAHTSHSDMNRQVGLFAVVCACTLSGLAGVYFEKVLKGSRNSLWSLNLQLSFFSLFPALFIGVLWKDGASVMRLGFFHGYNPVVWTAIIFQAAGGLIVAMCVAYADNIMKNFATSVSILISCLASVWFFDFVITMNVCANYTNCTLITVRHWRTRRSHRYIFVRSTRCKTTQGTPGRRRGASRTTYSHNHS